MTREEKIAELINIRDNFNYTLTPREVFDDAIKALEQEPNTVALGEDMRICRESITDEKVLIGFNMAVALCNKHLGESEEV